MMTPAATATQTEAICAPFEGLGTVAHLTSAALVGTRQGARSRWARRTVRPRGHARRGELVSGGERRQRALIAGLG